MRVVRRSTWIAGAALLGVGLVSASSLAQPIEQRLVTFVAPSSTQYVVLAANQYRILEGSDGCEDADRFHQCLLERNRQWRQRVDRVGGSRSFDLPFNVNGAARLYFTCGRSFSIDQFLQLNRRYVDGMRYTIACPALTPAPPKTD